MTNFLRGPNNTFRLNHTYPSFGRPWTRVYADTLIDSWFVGDFSSASYHITVEYDSNEKETLQVLVVARPEHASFTVYGRTSIQYELITLSATVTASKLNLNASALPGFEGAKVIFTATYGETINQLGKPTVVSGSGSFGGSGAPTAGNHTIGSIAVLSQSTVTAGVESDTIMFLNGTGITITTDSVSKAVTFNADVNMFKNISNGASTVTATSPNDTLLFVAGDGISIDSSSANKSIAISLNGVLSSNLAVDGNITSTGNITGTLVTANQPNITAVGTLSSLTVTGNITGLITNCIGLPLPGGVTGILSVQKGGTGTTTLSGLLKGNGTDAIVSATAGTDYLTPSITSTFTAAQIFNSITTVTTHETYQTITQSSSTIGINFANGNIVYLNQSANITGFTFSGITVGKSFSFNIIRQNTAGTALSIIWGSAFKWSNGSSPTLSNTANAIDIITCITFNGGLTIYGISSGSNFS